MARGRFVAYYRVSTDKQGRSGLGLDAQRSAVLGYLNGGDWSLVAEFVEVESGKRADRPQLAAALAACRLHGAQLVIAKLDRLARNVAFISALMEAGTEFVAVDMPLANRLTVHVLAAVDEHEAGMISARTKAALAEAKRRGVKLGNPQNLKDRAKGTAISAQVRGAAAARRAADLAPMLRELHGQGLSLRRIAAELDARGIPSPRGGEWSAVAVKRALDRAGVA